MSRSQPTDRLPHPCRLWLEWHGETGAFRTYHRETKTRVTVPLPLTVLVLDQLATVGGWHDASASAIYANEVRDTRTDPMTVKAFKEGTIATGLYREIKETVHAAGGHFVSVVYIALKDEQGVLTLGAIQWKGAALRAWMEFTRDHRAHLYEQAVEVTGYEEGKKGRVVFRVPTFRLRPVSADTHAAAVAVDTTLQTYLRAYLERTQPASPERHEAVAEPDDGDRPREITDDDIPF